MVRPHFALANDHLRLHLGIDVPEPDDVDLNVGGVRHGWEQGRVIAFDDSIVHSVQHRGRTAAGAAGGLLLMTTM